jgi:predicted ATPase
MIFLRSINLKQKNIDEGFPFTLPIFRNFKSVQFESPVVFFVGENGSGKSTLIEAIAYGMNAIAVGSENLETDDSLEHIRSFSSYLRFIKNRSPKKGFFFRSEDFFGFIKRIKREVREFKELESEYEGRFTGYAKLLATGMAKNQHGALRSRYGDDPDAFSHGESFLNLFKSRLVPEGLYILDEPETPLSPQKQLSFLSLLKQMVTKSCQFIIATHSPILMAYPDAQILSFDGPDIKKLTYEEVEHVSLTKSFLNNPDNYLRRL